MSVTAIVQEGKIALPPEAAWPSGTRVRVEPLSESAPNLGEALQEFDGMAEDLPSDLAANLDHYRHGLARK